VVEAATEKNQEHLEDEHGSVLFDADKVYKQQWKGHDEHRKPCNGDGCSEVAHEPLQSPKMRQQPQEKKDEHSDDKRPTNLLDHSLRFYKTYVGIQVMREGKL
jgi:hypothetical protein